MLSEAWEALKGEATSRKAADAAKGEDVSLRTANAATADGVGEDKGEGDVAPRLRGSRAMLSVAKPSGSPDCACLWTYSC